MLVQKICPFCRSAVSVEVPLEDYEMWQDGTAIQHACPTLSADEREILMTGICPNCWDATVGVEEE